MLNQSYCFLNLVRIIQEHCHKRESYWKTQKRWLLLMSVILPLNLLSGGIETTQAAQGACLSWDITGQWSYSASEGGYGTMSFQQTLSNGWLTGSWQNHATGSSGTFDSGGIVRLELGFHPTPTSTWKGSVSADGTTVRGSYTDPTKGYNGTWEMHGQARCTMRQAVLPPGSGRVTIRWGDYVFRLALDSGKKSSAKTTEKAVTSVTGVPLIPNPYAVKLGIEAVYRGTNLSSRLKVYKRIILGEVEYQQIGSLTRVGTTPDGMTSYSGSVTIPQRELGPGERIVTDIYIWNPATGGKDYVTQVLQTIVDPSGYIYDAATGRKLEGAMVSCYKRQGGSWVLWNAEAWKQINPLVSDNVGHYGWDVPTGDYKVVVSRNCYQDGSSPVVTVPPPRTDVHIGLKKTGCSNLKLKDIWTTGDGGLSKSVFRSGEPLNYHVEVTNSSTGDLSSTIHWMVTDPKGQKVAALSGTGLYKIASFGVELSIEKTLPLNLAPGDYKLRVTQTYQKQTSTMVTQFSVIPGGRVAEWPVCCVYSSGARKKSFCPSL